MGFKPTFGLVPEDGCFPLAASFDHVGPMARDVRGCVDMLHALVPGFEPAVVDALRDVRLGVAWTARADPLKLTSRPSADTEVTRRPWACSCERTASIVVVAGPNRCANAPGAR